ncbi:hypothetical protein LCI18_012815 [Fusarium solani-melongenae]|uniref:Uncharacterized protein n=1 Tax=Fusarium solani subsp. cucurbitae TaxID=2747967 RepID=A0ACD3ZKZ8_FUSSC|nr:hypothetical protein LCI18_012815 [Fusarium solani-melongenae]
MQMAVSHRNSMISRFLAPACEPRAHFVLCNLDRPEVAHARQSGPNHPCPSPCSILGPSHSPIAVTFRQGMGPFRKSAARKSPSRRCNRLFPVSFPCASSPNVAVSPPCPS